MAELNPRQAAFVREFLVDRNATQAYIRAGYSPNGAKVAACKLLAKANVRDAIAAQTEKREATLDMTADELARLYAKCAREGIGDDSPMMKQVGLKAAKQLCELLGWDAPKKAEVGKPGDFARMGEEERIAEIGRLLRNVGQTQPETRH